MKVLKRILFLCLLATLAACTEDAFIPESEIIPSGDSNIVDLISMVVPDIEMDATTRSALVDDGSQLKFEWQENDAIGVVPMSGRPLSFPIHAENAGKNTALFDGGGWALKSSEKYAAFFPINVKNQETDIRHIAVNYTGQTQGNYTDYDFLATAAVQASNGQVTFNMQRMSAILKITISMPAGGTARYGTLIASSEVFCVKGTLDLSGSEPVYTPKGSTKFINTDLGFDKTSSEPWAYTVYMMVPPADLSGQTFTFRMTSDAGYAYEATLTGKNFEAGKAYQLTGTAKNAVIKNSNVIAAAQNATDNPQVGTFTTNSQGFVDVNENIDKIAKVVKLNLSYNEDPTICDEIGYFRKIKKLYCGNYANSDPSDMIKSLDVSNNPELEELAFGCNQVTSIDLSNNPKLKTLSCFLNQLTSLDVSNNTELENLRCYRNQIISLDLSNNPNVKILQCFDNQLTSLNVSNSKALPELSCYNNQLTSLDVSNNTALTSLILDGNQLTSLDVSKNTALETLRCYGNHLSSLNVSNNTALKELNCGGNMITSLDVTNNTALTKFDCSACQLTALNVSNNTQLTELNCYWNQLTSLDLSNNVALQKLQCYHCQLTTLDVSNNTALNYLTCNNNQLTTLDVSNNPLTYLSCGSNLLTSLDLSNNTALQNVYCGNNQFETLSINNLPNLQILDVSYNLALTSLRCYSNHLNVLDVSYCGALYSIMCFDNYLKTLDLGTCPVLRYLRCYNNMMSSLNITLNTSLYLYSSANDSFCMVGNQYADQNRDSYQTLTLTARAADTTSLNTNTQFNNGYVDVIKE